MKTVLTQLKEKLQDKVSSPIIINIERDIFQRVIDVIDECCFEKEKEQIMEAWQIGLRQGAFEDSGFITAEDYYQQTFKSDE